MNLENPSIDKDFELHIDNEIFFSPILIKKWNNRKKKTTKLTWYILKANWYTNIR